MSYFLKDLDLIKWAMEVIYTFQLGIDRAHYRILR